MYWELFLSCFNGPRVYRKYRDGVVAGVSDPSPTGAYKTNFLEDHCGFIVGLIETSWSVVLYISPFLAVSAAYRRTIVGMSPELALKLALGIAFVYGGAYLGRGLGRAMNKDYLAFLQILFAASRRGENATLNMRNLRRYDFDFRHWPINYQWRDVDKFGEKVHARKFLPDYETAKDEGAMKKFLMDGLSYVVAHTVARRLAYPGTLALLQTAVAPALDQAYNAGDWRVPYWLTVLLPYLELGRTKLVEQSNAERFKLRTQTGNEIDSMFVDRRNNANYPNGNILVVTCEGNGGFYEVGSAATPLEGGYSVLMWNHPGFGASTGVPWPSEEAAAVDVVVQFALNKGWDEGDIVMYGWSIGGYTATWISMNYRNIRALVLDATFDDIVPLAVHTMPQSWSPLVVRTVRTYLNLHIEKQLAEFGGPVLLIRRLKDEVMASVEGAHDLATMRKVNRANNLLKNLLADRFPNLFRDDQTKKVVDDWLAATVLERERMSATLEVDDNRCRAVLQNYIREQNDGNASFPLPIGADLDLAWRQKLALYLASKYLVEFDSTHCTPLPATIFFIPNHPWE